MISDLTKYKQAKLICKDLDQINNLLTDQLKELIPHKKYVPVKYIINCIMEQKAIIDLHYKKHHVILSNKGKIHDKLEKS